MRHEKIFNEHEVLDEKELCIHDASIALDDSRRLLEGFCGLMNDVIEDITISLQEI